MRHISKFRAHERCAFCIWIVSLLLHCKLLNNVKFILHSIYCYILYTYIVFRMYIISFEPTYTRHTHTFRLYGISSNTIQVEYCRKFHLVKLLRHKCEYISLLWLISKMIIKNFNSFSMKIFNEEKKKKNNGKSSMRSPIYCMMEMRILLLTSMNEIRIIYFHFFFLFLFGWFDIFY